MSRSTFCLLVSPLMSIFKFYDITIKLFALSFNKNLSISSSIKSDISSIVVVFFLLLLLFHYLPSQCFVKKNCIISLSFQRKIANFIDLSMLVVNRTVANFIYLSTLVVNRTVANFLYRSTLFVNGTVSDSIILLNNLI